MVKLHGYQVEDYNAISAAFCEHDRILYTLPTGGGKTEVAVAVVRETLRTGGKALFLAHRRELVNQAVNRLGAAGVKKNEIGVIMGADSRTNSAAPIQVASIDTIRRRNCPEAGLVVIDEAHRATAKSYKSVLESYPNAKILGLTASPYRLDGKGLREVFDDLVVGPSPEALIALGNLAPPRTFTVPDDQLPELSRVRTVGGDYDRGQLGETVNRTVLIGSIVRHWFELGERRRTVVFAVNVEHSKSICQAFIDAGVRAEHIDGTTSTAERDAVLARLREGYTEVVCNCEILTEGWDSPPVKCVVLARPTQSTGLYLQMSGRILRPWNDVTPLILDHAGNAVKHGLPQWTRTFSLDAPKKRKGGVAPCKTCPDCHEVVPASTQECPCGYVFFLPGSPEEKEGNLVEVDGELRPLCKACGVRPVAARAGGGLRKTCSRECRVTWQRNFMKKYHTSMAPEQKRKLAKSISAGHSAKTPEQRSDIATKRYHNRTPEQNEAFHRAQANMTPETRSDRIRKLKRAHHTKTPEQRSDIATKRYHESENARKFRLACLTPESIEKRNDSIRKAHAAMTPEQRGERARKIGESHRKRFAAMTPEQRAEHGRKIHEARRAKKQSAEAQVATEQFESDEAAE